MSKTKKYIRLAICAASIIALLVLLTPVVKDWITEANSGFKKGTPEFAIASALELYRFPESTLDYAIDSDAIFAVSTEPDLTSRYAVLAKDENGNYTQNREKIMTMGESLAALGFDATSDAPLIYEKNGKLIGYIPIIGYPILSNVEVDFSKIIDINKVKVFDSQGKDLSSVRGDKFILYYFVNDTLPDHYKVYMEYDNHKYTIFDTDEKIPF